MSERGAGDETFRYASPPPPGPPVQPAAYAFPHAEPQPYHLMLRTWTYAWWKPVVGVLAAVVAFFVLAAIVFFVVVAIGAAFLPGSYQHAVSANDDPNKITPLALLGLNLGLASLVLVSWLLIRVVHHMRPRWLSSVVPRLRWRFLFVCLVPALIALVAQVGVGTMVSAGDGSELGSTVNAFTTTTAWSIAVVVLTTPLQAAGEEYLFRGYLLMAVGSFFSNKWLAIGASALVFALAHGSQNFPLFFDRLAFGLIAAWLVIRTGGLEAGIALHVCNNFLAYGFALAFGDLSSTLGVTESSWSQIPVTVAQSVVYTALVLLAAGQMGLQTTTRPPGTTPDGNPGTTVAKA